VFRNLTRKQPADFNDEKADYINFQGKTPAPKWFVTTVRNTQTCENTCTFNIHYSKNRIERDPVQGLYS